MERETGFEPGDPQLGKTNRRVCRAMQALTTDGNTVREVATRLCVSTATVYKLCATGKLPHSRVLGAIRVAPADLVAFIRTHVV